MNTPNLKIGNRIGRFRARTVWPLLLAALALVIVAGLGSNSAFAASTDPSAHDTGQSQPHEKIEIKLANNDHTDAQPNSPRVAQRPSVTPGIAANGVRMYDVSPSEAGGWPVRPGNDDTYGRGELLAVEVRFTEDVRVNGNATFRITLGSNSWRELVPVSHRDDSVIFATLIQPGERDTDGVWIGDHNATLAHNPANYFRTDEDDADDRRNVSLNHSRLGRQSGHKVNGNATRPKVNRVRITSSPQFADYYVRGEAVTVEVRFDRSVRVRGNPSARLRVEALGAAATRHANYFSGSGSSTLVFQYNVGLLDNDSNGIAIPGNALARNGDIGQGTNTGGSIKDSSGSLHANLSSGGRGNDRNQKVDARYAGTPEIMANAQWAWAHQVSGSDSVSMDFTVRQDPGHFSEDHALVMAFGWSSIGSTKVGYGIRTDLDDPETDGSEGKGIVFNRWGTHDKTLARPTSDGWVVTGNILGNFISIRKPYEWGEGDYSVRIAHDGSADDPDGRWFGMWIRNKSTNVETHMGSLKFPLVNGEPPKFNPRGDLYQSMLAILGSGAIKPHEIPMFEIALSPPDEGDNIEPPKRVTAVYSQFNGVMTNANISHNRDTNRVIMRAGGTTSRTTAPGTVITIRNDPAEGIPTVAGPAQVGEALQARTDGISDPDGPDQPSFSYQWIRNNGRSDRDIRGANARYYTVTNVDRGQTIKVRVSFTDDAGYAESLTSAPTEMVPLAPITAGYVDLPSSHNGRNSFLFELRFSESVSGLSYLTLRDDAFTVEGGEVVKARRLFRPKNRRWEITVQPSGNGAVTITLPATTDCASTGAICADDGRMLSNASTATVNGP